MIRNFCVLLMLFSIAIVGCGDGSPNDVKPVKAESTGAPTIDKKKLQEKKSRGGDRGERLLEEKISRGSRGGRGPK